LNEAARPSRAVLDTDVIFSRVLHELFGRIATELRLLTLIWSDELIAEGEGALIDRKPMPARLRAGGPDTCARRSLRNGSTSPCFPTASILPVSRATAAIRTFARLRSPAVLTC
jgi:hypothetical protein